MKADKYSLTEDEKIDLIYNADCEKCQFLTLCDNLVNEGNKNGCGILLSYVKEKENEKKMNKKIMRSLVLDAKCENCNFKVVCEALGNKTGVNVCDTLLKTIKEIKED